MHAEKQRREQEEEARAFQEKVDAKNRLILQRKRERDWQQQKKKAEKAAADKLILTIQHEKRQKRKKERWETMRRDFDDRLVDISFDKISAKSCHHRWDDIEKEAIDECGHYTDKWLLGKIKGTSQIAADVIAKAFIALKTEFNAPPAGDPELEMKETLRKNPCNHMFCFIEANLIYKEVYNHITAGSEMSMIDRE